MRKIVYLFLLLGTAVMAQKTEKRTVSDFKEVKVSQSINIDFTLGTSKSVEVEVQDPTDMQYVKTEVSNGVLRVYLEFPKKLSKKTMSKVQVTISNPTLEGVKTSSSAKFNLLNQVISKSFYVETSSSSKYTGALVKTDNLKIESSSSSAVAGKFEVTNITAFSASSSSRISMNLKTNKLDGQTSSSSLVDLKGSAKTADISSSSSSKIDGADFIVADLMVTASSSALIKLDVTQSISGKASSSGKITYKNKPTSINVSTSSSGYVGKM